MRARRVWDDGQIMSKELSIRAPVRARHQHDGRDGVKLELSIRAPVRARQRPNIDRGDHVHFQFARP